MRADMATWKSPSSGAFAMHAHRKRDWKTDATNGSSALHRHMNGR